MKSMRAPFIASILLLLMACQEDAEISSSIEGGWKGTLAEVQLKPFGLPIPISKDVPTFDAELEFRSDRTIILRDDSQSIEGTYQLTGDKLTIDLDYSIENLKLSGTYDVETLTETSLIFHRKEDGATIVDPDGGQSVQGQLKVTLHFQRL